MFHFSHSKIIESFIGVSVIYELYILAGNLPVTVCSKKWAEYRDKSLFS